jgi:hypothetical protein
VRISIVSVRKCNNFDIGCKYVVSIVKSLCSGKKLFKAVKFLSKHVIGDN